jgi:hypothetical protein
MSLARGDGDAGRVLDGWPAVVSRGKGVNELGGEVGVALQRQFGCFCRSAAAAAAAAAFVGQRKSWERGREKKGRRNGGGTGGGS